ncbi:MAG: twin-arginine translocation signal domain-containing protein, partial [Halobacteria archaeon]|nr:twin-arginine translocation signal domain-containing protein [Halobacteria archaeon]
MKRNKTGSKSNEINTGRINRRNFLRATGGTLGGLALTTGSAAAQQSKSETGLVAELVDCLDSLGDAPEGFPHVDERGNTNGDFPKEPDEMAVFVNGFFSGRLTLPPVNQAYMVSEIAGNNGYDHPVVGFGWRSVMTWARAKFKAGRMGRVLARFVDSYKS